MPGRGNSAHSAVDLAALRSAQGQRDRARALLQPVVERLSTEGLDTADLKAKPNFGWRSTAITGRQPARDEYAGP